MFSSLISSSSSDPAGVRPGASAALPPGVAAPVTAGAPMAMPLAAANAAAASAENADTLALFRDVNCPVEVMLGTGKLSLRQCLGLERGSVIRLHQSAGEDLQIAVNGIRIAHGEVIIIDETIAVRVTHLVGPAGKERRG